MHLPATVKCMTAVAAVYDLLACLVRLCLFVPTVIVCYVGCSRAADKML
jgi:hypothetical protein